MTTKTCPHCGGEIDAEALRCPLCQNWVEEVRDIQDDKAPEFLPTLLFAYFWGIFGIHRFYTGNFAIGTAQLLTLGGCGIWSYIDFISICFNKYRDGQDRLLRKYNPNIGVTLFVISLIPLAIIFFVLMVCCTILMQFH